MNGSQRVDPDLRPDLRLKVEPRGRRIRLIPILPSLLTLGNLFCGFLGIAYTADALLLAGTEPAASMERIVYAGWILFLAMVFDALDGRVARITGQVSRFGGELDSLADMVTFGVAPAFMIKAIAERFLGFAAHPRVTLGFCAFYILCAALRLARYNVEADPEESGHKVFLGLPTPGAAGVVAGVAVVYGKFFGSGLTGEIAGMAFRALPFAAPVLGILMISRIPYPHVMNRFLRGPMPMKYLVFVAFIVVVAIILRGVEAVVAGALVVYALSGPFQFLRRLLSGRAARGELDIFD